MLNRTEVIEKLLEIRRGFNEVSLLQDDNLTGCLYTELDELIINIIGDFLSSEDKNEIKMIMEKTFKREISIGMAMVAIKEVVYSYFSNNQEDNKTEKKEDLVAAHYYDKGYR